MTKARQVSGGLLFLWHMKKGNPEGLPFVFIGFVETA